MNRIKKDDELLNLVITTQQQNCKSHSPFADHHVQWGKCVHVDDLSESEYIESCQMRKEYLMILLENLLPKMHHQLVGARERITFVNRYTFPYETGMIILLYCYS